MRLYKEPRVFSCTARCVDGLGRGLLILGRTMGQEVGAKRVTLGAGQGGVGFTVVLEWTSGVQDRGLVHGLPIHSATCLLRPYRSRPERQLLWSHVWFQRLRQRHALRGPPA